MTTATDKLAAFFALLDKRQRDEEARQAQERKEKEDGKLARLKPWYLESAQ
jgi:hypothetical protein